MPFDKEFEHHLHEVMVSASTEVRDEIERHKRDSLWRAQKNNNAAAIPAAYSEAAIYAFRTRTRSVIDSYFQALDNCAMTPDRRGDNAD
jgi:hypothetical protein